MLTYIHMVCMCIFCFISTFPLVRHFHYILIQCLILALFVRIPRNPCKPFQKYPQQTYGAHIHMHICMQNFHCNINTSSKACQEKSKIKKISFSGATLKEMSIKKSNYLSLTLLSKSCIYEYTASIGLRECIGTGKQSILSKGTLYQMYPYISQSSCD